MDMGGGCASMLFEMITALVAGFVGLGFTVFKKR
jgi:hypothetical protein